MTKSEYARERLQAARFGGLAGLNSFLAEQGEPPFPVEHWARVQKDLSELWPGETGCLTKVEAE